MLPEHWIREAKRLPKLSTKWQSNMMALAIIYVCSCMLQICRDKQHRSSLQYTDTVPWDLWVHEVSWVRGLNNIFWIGARLNHSGDWCNTAASLRQSRIYFMMTLICVGCRCDHVSSISWAEMQRPFLCLCFTFFFATHPYARSYL